MPAAIYCVDLLQMTLFTGPLCLLKYCHWTAGRDSELKDTHTLPYQVKLVSRVLDLHGHMMCLARLLSHLGTLILSYLGMLHKIYLIIEEQRGKGEKR